MEKFLQFHRGFRAAARLGLPQLPEGNTNLPGLLCSITWQRGKLTSLNDA